MNIEALRDYCLSKKAAEEGFPFGPETLVFKVAEKLFALTSVQDIEARVNLKCDPELAEELRDQYEGVIPGYHMNKKHWNTVSLDADVPDEKIEELIDHSYDLIFNKLPKNSKLAIEQLS